MDYKDTLCMPKTSFSMKANLPRKEPIIQEKWKQDEIYKWILESRKDKPFFLLLDGPPYANGDVHVGHALNKTLKDFVIRYKILKGYNAPFFPTWDTHGLPIENAVEKKGLVDKHDKKDTSKFRILCKEYAESQIKNQKINFGKLGLVTDFHDYEASYEKYHEYTQIRALSSFVEKGLVFRDFRPVMWSWSSHSALADAEIEYKDIHSPSLYCKFSILNNKKFEDTSFLVWTTTPWTLIGNQAIAINKSFEYLQFERDGEKYICSLELFENIKNQFPQSTFKKINTFKGKELIGIETNKPLSEGISEVLHSDHVTNDAGTGVVHIAPCHGDDDFLIGKKNNLKIITVVNDYGLMVNAGEFDNIHYLKVNKLIIEKMKENGKWFHDEDFLHSFPHDWRTGKPIIIKATKQWFIDISAIAPKILKLIQKVNWQSGKNKEKIISMIESRDYWCISRQRKWGVPLPFFFDENANPVVDVKLITHVAELFKKHGSNIWYERDVIDLVPNEYKKKAANWTKEIDIMDVWFDSGVCHSSVLKKQFNTFQADLYLEGKDQYRGWFNSSLLTSTSMYDDTPYKEVVTHGFVVNENGTKMSKSKGTTIKLDTIFKTIGSDILRTWIANVDYRNDVKIGDIIMQQSMESYRKIRNTIRFILGNLYDYDVSKSKEYQLRDFDVYILNKWKETVKLFHESFEKYNFQNAYKILLQFSINFLSALYFDSNKDVLYVSLPNDASRKAVQKTIHIILVEMVKMITIFTPHTAQEIYDLMVENKLCDNKKTPQAEVFQEIKVQDVDIEKWDTIYEIKKIFNKNIERMKELGILKQSLEAKLTFFVSESWQTLSEKDLSNIFLVSQINIEGYNKRNPNSIEIFENEISILVEKAQGEKCERCWNICFEISKNSLCNKCEKIINE